MNITEEMVRVAQEAYECAPSSGWVFGRPRMRFALEAAWSKCALPGEGQAIAARDGTTFEGWLTERFGGTITDPRVIALMKSAWDGRGACVGTAASANGTHHNSEGRKHG